MQVKEIKLKVNKFATSNEATPQEPKRVIGQYNLTCRNKHKSPTQWCSRCLWDEHQAISQDKITLTGITTSQINQALKANNPYPARVFLKVANQEQDIPVFFRIKDTKGNYIRPKIKKGSHLQVEGYFSIGTIYTKHSERKSFIATSYQLLTQELNQQIETHGKQSLSK